VSASQNSKQQLEKIERMITNMKTTALLRATTKSCPSCGLAIEKNGGCNKMTCSKCGGYFCWLCGSKIKGYDHFQQKSCQLFLTQTVRVPVIQMNAAQLINNMQIKDNNNPDIVAKCPKCGSRQLKQHGNNHLRCINCPTQYCFICGATIYGTKHFSITGCKQHS